MVHLLALGSAVLYGAADFLGGLAARRASTVAVVLVSQAAGLLVLLPLLLVLPGAASRPDLLWGGLAGLAGGTGVALLYRALAVGTMSVVAPTTAVCAVMLPVVVDTLMGQRLAPLTQAGIGLALVAIVLVSQHQPDAQADGAVPAAPNGPASRGVRREHRLPPGIGLAFLSGVAIGVFFLVLARTDAAAGLWPLVGARAASIALFGALAAHGPHRVRLPWPVARATVACGVVDMLANALYLLASRGGPLSVVVTLTSLYPASTVVLARVVMGERLSRRQQLGIGCALVAVVLIVSPS